jgi:hypothetical protein
MMTDELMEDRRTKTSAVTDARRSRRFRRAGIGKILGRRYAFSGDPPRKSTRGK